MWWLMSVGIWSAWETWTAPSQKRLLLKLQPQPGEFTLDFNCWRGHTAILKPCGGVCWLHPAMTLRSPLFSGETSNGDPDSNLTVAWERVTVSSTSNEPTLTHPHLLSCLACFILLGSVVQGSCAWLGLLTLSCQLGGVQEPHFQLCFAGYGAQVQLGLLAPLY